MNGSVTEAVVLQSGNERFTVQDLGTLVDLVASTWRAASDRDWSVLAGTLEWTCLATADHAVDCVYAPAFFLASRKQDGYPEYGNDLKLGQRAQPTLLVESLHTAARMLAGVVNDAEAESRAAIFGFPKLVAPPFDFVPRGAIELILHTHDIAVGLGVSFEPPTDLCRRLREHTRPWPMWTIAWSSLEQGTDPWGDLLTGSGRERPSS